MFKSVFVIAVAYLKFWKVRDVGLPSVPALDGFKLPSQGRAPCLRHGISCRENVDRGSHTTAKKRLQSSWSQWEREQLFFKSSFKAKQ